jgi:hypothetical protein
MDIVRCASHFYIYAAAADVTDILPEYFQDDLSQILSLYAQLGSAEEKSLKEALFSEMEQKMTSFLKDLQFESKYQGSRYLFDTVRDYLYEIYKQSDLLVSSDEEDNDEYRRSLEERTEHAQKEEFKPKKKKQDFRQIYDQMPPEVKSDLLDAVMSYEQMALATTEDELKQLSVRLERDMISIFNSLHPSSREFDIVRNFLHPIYRDVSEQMSTSETTAERKEESEYQARQAEKFREAKRWQESETAFDRMRARERAKSVKPPAVGAEYRRKMREAEMLGQKPELKPVEKKPASKPVKEDPLKGLTGKERKRMQRAKKRQVI